MDRPLPAPMQAWLAHLAGQRRYSAHTLDGYGRDLRQLARLRALLDATLTAIAG